jgi:transmembrane sensor
MSDLAERVRAIGEHVDAEYDARRTEAALLALRTKLRRRRAKRVALASATGVLCLVLGTFAALRPWHTTRRPAVPKSPEALFTLSDGSVVMPLLPTSRLLAKTVSPRRVELELLTGSARFDVTPNREREFRVSAGPVAILVVGTKFSVERRGERTAVEVQDGRVRVEWERGQQLLHPGERGTFPPFETAGGVVPVAEPETPTTAPAPSVRPRPLPARTVADWRVPARRGEFALAYRMLSHPAKAATPANDDDLMLAADVARKSGHAADAVPYLERALALHAGDARSAVAAFTLGRVRLADLHDPAGAAEAFARARAVAPQGPLAEDALAREVEARFRSGDKARARTLAEEYVKLWPSGSRMAAVRHFGGLP